MRFERMTRELYAKPWAIMPQVYDAFHATFQNMVEGRKLDASIEIFGEKIEYKLPEEYDVIQGVAVIQIDGVLGYRISEIDKACMGAVDYRDIRNAIAKANNDESVSSILLEINSPGGMVTGLKETAEFIANSAKAHGSFYRQSVRFGGVLFGIIRDIHLRNRIKRYWMHRNAYVMG
jgi:capsid assembly protease